MILIALAVSLKRSLLVTTAMPLRGVISFPTISGLDYTSGLCELSRLPLDLITGVFQILQPRIAIIRAILAIWVIQDNTYLARLGTPYNRAP